MTKFRGYGYSFMMGATLLGCKHSPRGSMLQSERSQKAGIDIPTYEVGDGRSNEGELGCVCVNDGEGDQGWSLLRFHENSGGSYRIRLARSNLDGCIRAKRQVDANQRPVHCALNY